MPILDQLMRRVEEGLGFLERIHCGVIEKIETTGVHDPHLGKRSIPLQIDLQEGVAILASVDLSRRIPALEFICRLPVIPDLLLHAVEERRIHPTLGIEGRLVPFLDIHKVILRSTTQGTG
jgi:hypothetical protein